MISEGFSSTSRRLSLAAKAIVALLLLSQFALAGPAESTPTTSPDHPEPTLFKKPTIELRPGEKPQIQFTTREINFGIEPAGRVVELDFFFTNTGNGPLEIVDLQADCGCTTSGEYDKVIAPTVNGRIPIRLSTRRLRGPVEKIVHVITNVEGADSHIKLILRGEVFLPITVTPESINFGQMQRVAAERAPLAKFVRIDNATKTPINPTISYVSHPAIRPKINVAQAGKKFVLQIVLQPPFDPGVTYGTIRIATSFDLLPEIEIPVSAYFASDLEASPNRIGVTPNQEAAQREIQIVNRAKAPLKISDLRSESNKLQVSAQGSGVGPYKIQVAIPGGYKMPPGGDAVSFNTGYEKTPRMRIPVYVFDPPQVSSVPAPDHPEAVEAAAKSKPGEMGAAMPGKTVSKK